MADVREIVALPCFTIRTGGGTELWEYEAGGKERARALRDADAILSALSSRGLSPTLLQGVLDRTHVIEEGWRPIETLDLDGRLVMYAMAGGVCIAPAAEPCETPREDLIERAKGGDWPDYQKWAPTHWRPVPTLPTRDEG